MCQFCQLSVLTVSSGSVHPLLHFPTAVIATEMEKTWKDYLAQVSAFSKVWSHFAGSPKSTLWRSSLWRVISSSSTVGWITMQRKSYLSLGVFHFSLETLSHLLIFLSPIPWWWHSLNDRSRPLAVYSGSPSISFPWALIFKCCCVSESLWLLKEWLLKEFRMRVTFGKELRGVECRKKISVQNGEKNHAQTLCWKGYIVGRMVQSL